MAKHTFTVDLSGLELNEMEQARISQALQRAAMTEIASVSATRGKGAPLDLELKLFPKKYGGLLDVAHIPLNLK